MTASSRDLRIATLVLAPLVAAVGAVLGADELVLYPASVAMIGLWAVMALTLVIRAVHEARRPDAALGAAWDTLDVLTATGCSVLWGGALALLAAGLTGWASFGVVGVLGLAAVQLAAIWTALVAGGDAPWRHATVAREILPALATEGDPLREELLLDGVWIPPGMRMFATGRTTPHGPATRYAVDASASRAELRLTRELGPAPRGEHRAPALALWLRDALGLTRSPVVLRGEASFTVLPRPADVRGARGLLGPGGDDALAIPTQRQPTEGTFRIRTYAPGDDTRRIHWVRSLQANELVVRLPDEVPPDDPAVRVILDNELRGADALACRAPDALLDAMVRIWLGVARALAEAGTRVTLVTAADAGRGLAAVERAMLARAPRDGLALGGKVRWQADVPLAGLVERAGRQIVVSCRPRAIAAEVAWIAVPEAAWAPPEIALPPRVLIRRPFPSGSADNRAGRRRAERRRIEAIAQDRAVFSEVMCAAEWRAWSGHRVARPSPAGVQLEVIP